MDQYYQYCPLAYQHWLVIVRCTVYWATITNYNLLVCQHWFVIGKCRLLWATITNITHWHANSGLLMLIK